MLSQVQNGEERVIAYYLKMLTIEEANYCTTRKEMLAIIKAIKHFRPYLLGRRFKVRTDHASLTRMMNAKNPAGQLARWLETLSTYDYKLEYRPGKNHGNVDGLSRHQCIECWQC